MLKYFQFLFLAAILFGYLNSSQSISQTKQITIEVLKNSPANYEGDEVEFSGLVTQYVKDKGSTNYYLIKGDFGGIIRVNTSEPAPETNNKYRVKGIVYIDSKTNTVFVSEKTKMLLPAISKVTSKSDTIVNVAGDESNITVTGNGDKTGGDDEDKTNTLLYILVGALVVLIGAFIYFQMKKKNLENEVSPSNNYQEPAHHQQTGYPSPEYSEVKPDYTTDNDYKTIKIAKSSPKTFKFIPGKLVITDGADRGKEFKIAGYPGNGEGFIVTIGRKEVNGERAYAHIQLKEKTVSREQAELFYKNNKLYLKNLSETNFTQLNGSELNAGQMSEVNPGSSIRTGEVEFKYMI